MSDTLTLALWATCLSRPLAGLDDWLARVDAKMAEAADAGARLFLMPEYAAEQWLSFKPPGLPPTEEIAWMASHAPAAVEGLAPLAARHGMALLAGTMPWALDGGGHGNRAWLLLPDGRCVAQDKLALTPSEKDAASWTLTPGTRLEVVEWAGLRIATLVCLDVEMPALAARLAPLAPDLVLVPSMTSAMTGYSRVFGCAKARAVELMAAVAVCGVIGATSGTTQNDTNVSGAALYLPCEAELGAVGIHAELPPVGDDDGDGPLLIARDVPFATIRRLRAGAAEVWPGAWSADHVTVG